MVIPKINSAHGSETRNIINAAINSINAQGRSIQDLVADGQLTPEQYADLIKSINGMISKGNVSVHDISKNLGKFDSTFFTTEFIEQLNNGIISTTNVLPKSISPVEIQKNGVTADHIDFISKTRNLFDNSRLIHGRALTNTGDLAVSSSASTTDYLIEVLPETTYYKNDIGSILELDKDVNVVGYHSYSNTSGAFETSNSTRYLRLSVNTSRAKDFQLELGSSGSDYVPYARFINNSMINITGGQIENESVPIDKLSGFIKSRNMIDGNRMVNAYININNGELVDNQSNRATNDYIAIEGNTTYNFQPVRGTVNIAFYNSQKEFISSHRITADSANGNITTPSGAALLRLSVVQSIESESQLEKGSEPTEYEPYYMYHPGIISPMDTGGGGGESEVSTPNLLEILNPYDVRFSFPIKNNQMASFRFSNSGTGDDFMKGRESSILNNNLNKLFDLTHESSNKEFAISVSDGTQDRDWFPEHNGVSTAYEGTSGYRKLVADGNNIDISKTSNIPIKFNTAILTQKMELSLPYDTTPRAILTFVVTIEDGECKESIRVEWKKNATVHAGYFFMTPMSTPDFVDGLLTNEFEYVKSKPGATTQTSTQLNKIDANEFYFTSDRTDKTDILFTTEIVKVSEAVKSLFWQHRSGQIEKLYPQQFNNTTRQTGDVDYAEGVYKIKIVPKANETYNLN